MGNWRTEWGEYGGNGWKCKKYDENVVNHSGNAGNQGGDAGNPDGNLDIAVEMTEWQWKW